MCTDEDLVACMGACLLQECPHVGCFGMHMDGKCYFLCSLHPCSGAEGLTEL